MNKKRPALLLAFLFSFFSSHLFAQRKISLADIRVIEFDSTVFFKKISKTWMTYEIKNGDWISCVMKKGPSFGGKLLGQMHDSIAVAKWDIKDLTDTIYLDTVLVCAQNLYRVVAEKPKKRLPELSNRHTSIGTDAVILAASAPTILYMEAARVKSIDMTQWELWN